MARQKSDNRKEAKKLYIKSLGKKKLKDIADEIGVSASLVRKWKSLDKWDEELSVMLPNVKDSVTVTERKKGGQPGNKNAYGNKGGSGSPEGNIRALKHGAYSNIYINSLSEEDQELLTAFADGCDLQNEIAFLRFRLASLMSRKNTIVYDMLGNRHEIEISEENRDKGIVAYIDQLRKMTDVQAKIKQDVEKFAFDKHKFEVDTEIKKERLAIQKQKLGEDDDGYEDDGFIEALKASVKDVWSDE